MSRISEFNEKATGHLNAGFGFDSLEKIPENNRPFFLMVRGVLRVFQPMDMEDYLNLATAVRRIYGVKS